MKPSEQKAFTLVELLVVIAIIGLLSTVAVVALNSSRTKARDTKRIADIKQIITAMQLYYDDNGTYPQPSTLGCAYGGNTWYCLGHGTAGSCWQGAYNGCDNLDGAMSPYIANVPDDPANNTAKNGDAYMYSNIANDPILFWGIDGADTSTLCLGGTSGQWGVEGDNRYYCLYHPKP